MLIPQAYLNAIILFIIIIKEGGREITFLVFDIFTPINKASRHTLSNEHAAASVRNYVIMSTLISFVSDYFQEINNNNNKAGPAQLHGRVNRHDTNLYSLWIIKKSKNPLNLYIHNKINVTYPLGVGYIYLDR